jgi:hypothetical protein
MASSTDKILIMSAGNISMTPGVPISFTVTWGHNVSGNFISPFRWSRIWPAVQGASDEANFQTVTILSEGSRWDSPASIAISATLRGDSDNRVPVVAKIEVMAAQADTF